jgi:CHAT domain-containing protein
MAGIEKHIGSWREALEQGRAPGPAPAELRKLVWAPLERHLAGAKVVLVSPDRALGRLPFAALPGKEKGRYLLEEVPLAVLPVPQFLPQLLQPAEGKPSLLTLGGVDFGGRPGTWEALPATGPETDGVVASFRAQIKGGLASLRGAKATKPALAEHLPRHRFAHLATHGYFAPPQMKSALSRDVENGPHGLFGREGITGWHPGLLSGLVLAGANRPTPEDDGVLTALEIAEMGLSGVELAVLSACQTGLGQEAAGEGMMGLQRAFAVAGCKSVVSSLWSVHDAATAVLMGRFYHHLWEKKLSKLEALRQAQLEVLRHPEWVEEQMKKMRGIRGLRGVGKASEEIVAGKKQRRSPVAWWAAWQLSGDWR